ncbi:MAG: hypothetical protein NTY66_00460 [Candidatus Vogelbacteria bacterium]|nr:hypothetical protein [Candidatus Vogelbacteria bacterium]
MSDETTLPVDETTEETATPAVAEEVEAEEEEEAATPAEETSAE